MSKNFLILLGVSGVGKSTLITELIKMDSRFFYISPFTNRPLRSNEKDKIYKTNIEIERIVNNGEILILNELHGYKYATPRKPINNAFKTGKFPVLDFPVNKLEKLKKKYSKQIFSVYVMPPSLKDLQKRLNDGRDKNGQRYNAGVKEIRDIKLNKITGYDFIVINDDVSRVAKLIYKKFLAHK